MQEVMLHTSLFPRLYIDIMHVPPAPGEGSVHCMSRMAGPLTNAQPLSSDAKPSSLLAPMHYEVSFASLADTNCNYAHSSKPMHSVE
jgi:hypothetical protein